MRQLLRLLSGVIGLLFLSTLNLQGQSCTPLNPFPPGGFVYPLPFSASNPEGGISDTAFVGVAFQTTLHVLMPSEITVPGFGTLPVLSFSIPTVGAFTGMPASMTYLCNPPNCVFTANNAGCINIFGTATSPEIGVHDLLITGTLNSIFPIPVTLPTPGIVEGNYYLHVKECPVYDQEETASICAGEVYTFPDGSSAQLFENTSYVSTFLASNGCDSLITTVVEVVVVDTGVTQDGATLTATGAGSYQWIDCAGNQPVSGETGATFSPSATGEYAVIVSAGACQDTSACFSVVVNGVSDQGANRGLKISPNPAGHTLHLALDEPAGPATLVIRTISGQEVIAQALPTATRHDVDVSGLVPGIYTLSLRSETGVKVERFVKK